MSCSHVVRKPRKGAAASVVVVPAEKTKGEPAPCGFGRHAGSLAVRQLIRSMPASRLHSSKRKETSSPLDFYLSWTSPDLSPDLSSCLRSHRGPAPLRFATCTILYPL